MRVLMVEDDGGIAEVAVFFLEQDGYETRTASDGEQALSLFTSFQPDLVILDLGLSGMGGLDLFHRFRRMAPEVPVIIATSRTEESDRIAGLEMGADDYVTKPFSPRVLLARVRALLRKSSAAEVEELELLKRGQLVIDLRRHEARFGEQRVDLTHSEFMALHFLAKRPGWVFSRNQIIKAVHGESYPVTERSVDVLIVGLRKKLGAAGEQIETVRGMGYRFREQ